MTQAHQRSKASLIASRSNLLSLTDLNISVEIDSRQKSFRLSNSMFVVKLGSLIASKICCAI